MRQRDTKRKRERYIYINYKYIYYIFNKNSSREDTANVSSKKISVNNRNGETIKIVNMLIVRY